MKIKSEKEMFYKGIDNQGNVEKGEHIGSQERLYNEQGNLLKETSYHADGTIEDMKNRLYDAHGQLIEENIYGENVKYYNGYDGSIHHKVTYLYDAHGNLIEECDYIKVDWETIGNKNKFSKYTYIYDTQGNLLIEYDKEASDSEEEFIEKHIYTYDDKGNKIQDVWYKEEKLFNIQTYLYDEQGNLLEFKWQNSDGEISTVTYSYAYNTETQLTEITTFAYYGGKCQVTYKDAEGNEVLCYVVRTYEPKGTISSRTITKKDFEEYCQYNGDEILIKRWIKVYDDKGYCIEEKRFDYKKYTIKESDEIPEGDLEKSDICQNTYDENGNLIYQIRYIKEYYPEPTQEIIIREFIREYY